MCVSLCTDVFLYVDVAVLGFCTYACIHVSPVSIYVLAFVPVGGGLSLCLTTSARVCACLSVGLAGYPEPGFADQVGQERGGKTRISPAPPCALTLPGGAFRLLGGARHPLAHARTHTGPDP